MATTKSKKPTKGLSAKSVSKTGTISAAKKGSSPGSKSAASKAPAGKTATSSPGTRTAPSKSGSATTAKAPLAKTKSPAKSAATSSSKSIAGKSSGTRTASKVSAPKKESVQKKTPVSGKSVSGQPVSGQPVSGKNVTASAQKKTPSVPAPKTGAIKTPSKISLSDTQKKGVQFKSESIKKAGLSAPRPASSGTVSGRTAVKANPKTTIMQRPMTKTAQPLMPAGVIVPPDYKPTDREEFMNPVMMEYFRLKLIKWKAELLKEAEGTVHDTLQGTELQKPDPIDRASEETDHALELRTRDRERKLISKIDEALLRIQDGSYGYCEETGEPISVGRLDARPIATLSIEAQERHERKERTQRDD